MTTESPRAAVISDDEIWRIFAEHSGDYIDGEQWVDEVPFARAVIEAYDRARAVDAGSEPPKTYQQGWDECMAVWADHMKRMNAALTRPSQVGYANRAHELFQRIADALAQAPKDAS